MNRAVLMSEFPTASTPRLVYPIIFTHIPKTSGRSLSNFLRVNVSERCYLHASDLVDTPKEEVARLICPRAQEWLAVSGHMPLFYRVHELFDRHTVKVTMLREPVDRVVSHYYFMRTVARSHPVGKRLIDEDIALERYVSKPIHLAADNVMVRMLCSDDGISIPWGELTWNQLQQAKNNLARYFHFVGFTEFYEDLVGALCSVYGWHCREQERLNLNPSRPPLEEIPASTLELIRTRNVLDCELYDFARKLGGGRGVYTRHIDSASVCSDRSEVASH